MVLHSCHNQSIMCSIRILFGYSSSSPLSLLLWCWLFYSPSLAHGNVCGARKITDTPREVARLQILVSQKCAFKRRGMLVAACVCVCVCLWWRWWWTGGGVHACTWVCVPGSCTGPQGQGCVDWVSSTHSSLVESERNPHRWLSTFKKVGCVRHVNWGLSSFCSFLWHCSIQAIFVYSPQKVQKHRSLVTSENVFSNERSDYWTGACTCHSSPQITRSNLTCFRCYRWRACLFCKHREWSAFKLEIWHWTVRQDAMENQLDCLPVKVGMEAAPLTVAHHFHSSTVTFSPPVIQLMQLNTQLWYSVFIQQGGLFDRAHSADMLYWTRMEMALNLMKVL